MRHPAFRNVSAVGISVVVALFCLPACNTVEGMKKDLSGARAAASAAGESAASSFKPSKKDPNPYNN